MLRAGHALHSSPRSDVKALTSGKALICAAWMTMLALRGDTALMQSAARRDPVE